MTPPCARTRTSIRRTDVSGPAVGVRPGTNLGAADRPVASESPVVRVTQQGVVVARGSVAAVHRAGWRSASATSMTDGFPIGHVLFLSARSQVSRVHAVPVRAVAGMEDAQSVRDRTDVNLVGDSMSSPPSPLLGVIDCAVSGRGQRSGVEHAVTVGSGVVRQSFGSSHATGSPRTFHTPCYSREGW